MGLKLELFLAIVIVVTTVVTMSSKLSESTDAKRTLHKEIEFGNTMFTEVTTEVMESVAFGTHGVRIGGVLSVDNFVYHSQTVELLRAKQGRYTPKRIYLDGNVSFDQKGGFSYRTQHAYYDRHTEILYATSPFVATKGENVIHGERMAYRTQSKEVFATKVNAVIYTVEK